jgi:predicted metalloprotease with PDZ domain
MVKKSFPILCFNLFLFFLLPGVCISNIRAESFDFLAKSHAFSKDPVYTEWPAHKVNGEKYLVRISEPDRAFIEYTFTVTDSLLTMSERGAKSLENRWGEFVHDLSAKSDSGDEISVTRLQGGLWLLNAPRGQVVTLRYQVLLNHEDYEWSGGVDGAAYKRSHGVFYTGRSLFIMNGKNPQEIRVDFALPENWKATTAWNRFGSDLESYLVDSYSELTESMLFAGTHEELTFERNGFELVFALGSDFVIDKKEEYKEMAEGVLDFYIELMGGVPGKGAGAQLKRILVVLNSSAETDGEVIGNSISILEAEKADEMSQMISRFLFAHELFHLWNGKSFYPSDERCEWFKEGVSNYYTMKSLFHVGILNEEAYFNMLNAFFYQKYANDPGLGSISISEGNEKHDHWGLIYSGGMFAGIAQDMIIRSATNNEKSLDDLMREFFSEYGASGVSYSLEDLNKTLSELSGEDQSEFFETYVIGSAQIPLDSYLKLSGLSSEIKQNQLLISRKPGESEIQKKMIAGMLGNYAKDL